MRVLCFNVGSSGVRVAGFESHGRDLVEAVARRSVAGNDWRAAVPASFVPDLAAHRIVRGRKTGVAAEPFTNEVNAEILSEEDLAPTHDPHALTLVAASQRAFPAARQIVVYDSAFHATIPPEHATYAVPLSWRDRGIRRIGYHGLSCAYAAQWLAENGGNPRRAVHAHLGNGCSITALLDGRSVSTTMGYTPLEGIVMGTRSGSIDPAIPLQLERQGLGSAAIRSTLFRESGLRALCGTNDMAEIETRRKGGEERARLAFDVFVASAAGGIAQMAAAAGGIDALTFAGGIGVHSQAVRDAVCTRLEWMLQGARIYTIDVREERVMALAALALQARMPA